jgi:hypothetical protein
MDDKVVENKEEISGEVQDIVVAEPGVLPAKRARKATDKEFIVQPNQLATSKKTSGPGKGSSLQKDKSSSAKNTKKHQRGTTVQVAPPVAPPTNHFIAPSVSLSSFDKAAQLKLSKDHLVCYGCEVSV